MQIGEVDLIARLVEWLGPVGARAGLEQGRLSVGELRRVAKDLNLPVSSKPSRAELSNELAFAGIRKIDKDVAALTAMSKDELLTYLRQVEPTNSELISILESQGIRVGSADRRHLVQFAAQELSDIGLYARIAQGRGRASV